MDMPEIVRFAFYKPQPGDKFGRLISAYTGLFNPGVPAYSHVEIGFFIDEKWEYYSSASRNKDGTTGTRWLGEIALFSHPERWDVYEATAARPIWEMIETCDAELGKPYDWLGIMGFATLFGQLNSKRKWYCSEVCHYIFFGKWRKRVSPRRLYSEIKKYINTSITII